MNPDDRPKLPEEWPYITEESDQEGEHGMKPFIKNMRTGTVAGYKYFAFSSEDMIEAELRGTGKVSVRIDSPEGKKLAVICSDSETWKKYPTVLCRVTGTHALYFVVESGVVDFAGFGLWKNE